MGSRPPEAILTRFSSVPELLSHRAAEDPSGPWLAYLDGPAAPVTLTRGAFREAVLRTARFLLFSGMRKGDRVATVAYNHADTVVQYFACWSIGAVVVPVNVGEDDRRIAYILSDSRTRLLFVRAEFGDRIGGIIAGLPAEAERPVTVIVGEGAPVPEAPAGAAAGEFPAVGPEDDALIVYTSGTTGNPKGVVLMQYNLLADAMAIAEWHRMRPGETMMCVLPIHHVNGIVVTLVTPLWYGGSVVLMRKFHTAEFWPAIAGQGVGVVSVVPTLLQFLLKAGPAPPGADLTALRHVICGAGPLTCELAAAFEEAFGVPIIHGYGLSETTCYSCFLPLDLSRTDRLSWLKDHGFPSIGVPLPVNEMDIHDAAGIAQPTGIRGEIVIRGHNVMREYFAAREVNEQTFLHGWFRSGDEGFYLRDAAGRPFFFITGRLKELIIRGGTNISPFEIDEVLMNIPGVRAGLAVGFENDWYGEEIGAYVQRAEGSAIGEEEILAQCRAAFPFQKCPKVVVFGDDVPVTSTGKYQRNRLRPLFAPWKAVQFSESRSRQ